MRTRDLLTEMVLNNDELNQTQQVVINGQINRLFGEEDDRLKLITKIRNRVNSNNVSEVMNIDENLVIFKLRSDNKFLFGTYNIEKDKVYHEYSLNRHSQILVSLGILYDGPNQQFSNYASRMLNITQDQ